MATAKECSLSLLVLLGCFAVCHGGDFCKTSSSSWPSVSYDTTYCAYGCCGYYPSQYCCSFSVGVIVGGVIGSIAGIAILVALICCCVKSGQRGRVVTTQPWSMGNTGVAVVSSNNSNTQYSGYNPGYGQPMGAQPMGAQPMQPPPYSGPAPAYGYPNPAYPPAGTPDPYNNAGFKP
ncbi:uncharacterized protein [Littorina saxatilis]|uniref:Cysteine and tyrosine-rich protein 1 n=1 Tax=Littorina saxatilis TaxID=31220 RepID=A0AAN9B9J8_9CAEN